MVSVLIKSIENIVLFAKTHHLKTLYIIFKERTKGGLNKRATVGAPLFSTLLVFPN